MLSVTPQILAKQKTDTEYKAAGQALRSDAPGKIRRVRICQSLNVIGTQEGKKNGRIGS
jgi:hypothetical protein